MTEDELKFPVESDFLLAIKYHPHKETSTQIESGRLLNPENIKEERGDRFIPLPVHLKEELLSIRESIQNNPKKLNKSEGFCHTQWN